MSATRELDMRDTSHEKRISKLFVLDDDDDDFVASISDDGKIKVWDFAVTLKKSTPSALLTLDGNRSKYLLDIARLASGLVSTCELDLWLNGFNYCIIYSLNINNDITKVLNRFTRDQRIHRLMLQQPLDRIFDCTYCVFGDQCRGVNLPCHSRRVFSFDFRI